MTDMVAESIIKRRKPENIRALSDLIDGSATVAELAFRLQKTPDAIRKVRLRFERSAKRRMPRHEPRGRKPEPLN